MCADREIKTAKKNYERVEKEALANAFAIKMFHKMLYGRIKSSKTHILNGKLQRTLVTI